MWHFSIASKQLGYGDNREIIPGVTLKVPSPVELCNRGLHASDRLIDALKYAPGPYIWSVELTGEVIHGDDKSVASERTAVWGYDATHVLKSFSLWVALDSVEKFWDEKRVGVFPKVTKKWLQTGDESLRSAARSAAESAARSAAWSAARSAARSAAWSAAESAARSAAWSAAWSAARSASESATGSAARSATWSAAMSAQNTKLEQMILESKPKDTK